MNLAEVMDDLGAALETIDGLRVFPYWAARITPPAAVVGWPDPLTYDTTQVRGSDRVELPIHVLVGQVDQRSARDVLAAYAAGSGPRSVKAAIEGHQAQAYDTVRVMRCEFSSIPVAAVEYLAATFIIDITGPGA